MTSDGNFTILDGTGGGGNATTLLTAFSVTAELAPVPIPAAAWLFGSGLLGLVGMARRKKVV